MTPNDLIEHEAIKRLKYGYFRCIDQKQWDELGSLFTDDIVVNYSGGQYNHTGRDAVIEWLRSSMESDSFHSSHRASHPEITLDSPNEAHAVWAFDDIVIETKFEVTIRGAGFYDDRYRKVDGSWLISETGYKRSFEEIERRDGSGPQLTASWWSTGGVSSLEH